MHVTVDGFVAGPNGEMNWIYVDEELFDAAGERTQNADTALYGRKTWEMMDAYWPTAANEPDASKHDIEHGNWYNQVNKVVVSETLDASGLDKTTVIGNDLVAQIEQLKQTEGREIVIFGSPSLVRMLMLHKLIDDYYLAVNPVMLGRGIRLFADLEERVKLQLIDSRVFASKVVFTHYRIAD